MVSSTTHYRTEETGRYLFCTGRSVYLHYASSKLDEVTCRSCRRKLIAMAKRA